MRFLILLVFFSPACLATVTVHGLSIPGLHQKDGKGSYDQIIAAMFPAESGKVDIQVTIPARAEQKFSKCTQCCVSPANKNPEFYDYPASMLVSDPMNMARVYIFSAEGSAPIAGLDALKGKKVGVRRGMPYGKTFDSMNLDTVPVITIKANVQKLQKSRIDAFIAYVPDAYMEFEEMGIAPLVHAKDRPVAEHPDGLVCKGVSQAFIDEFNQKLDGLRQSGKLRQILGASYIE